MTTRDPRQPPEKGWEDHRSLTRTESHEATLRLHEKGDKRRTIGLHFTAAQAIAEYSADAPISTHFRAHTTPPVLPSGTLIEHRLFSEISKNWPGEPLDTYQKILRFIRSTKTQTGLSVTAHLDRRHYPVGTEPTSEQLQSRSRGWWLLYTLPCWKALNGNLTLAPRLMGRDLRRDEVPARMLASVQRSRMSGRKRGGSNNVQRVY